MAEADKREILSKVLGRGYQLDVGALDYMVSNKDKIQSILDALEKQPTSSAPSIITVDYILGLLGGHVEEGGIYAKLISTTVPTQRKEKTSVEEHVSILNDRYEKIRSMLMSKMETYNPTSINKAHNQKEFSIIGIVMEKDTFENTLLVEDQTGEVMIFLDGNEAENVMEDDIIGIVCHSIQKGVVAKQIIWPDIPINREIRKASGKTICALVPCSRMGNDVLNEHMRANFIKWLSASEQKSICIIFIGARHDHKKHIEEIAGYCQGGCFNIFVTSEENITPSEFGAGVNVKAMIVTGNASMFSINDVCFLVARGELFEKYALMRPEPESSATMINILKRRFMSSGKETMIIGGPPDIFIAAGGDSAATSNYKGTTLVSVNEFSSDTAVWVIDLNSREINKLDLS
jgi:DNA polymerase II small subunit/DNA polymerase delta subunit B